MPSDPAIDPPGDRLSLRSLFLSVGCIHMATAALGTLVALQVAETGGTQSEAAWVASSYSLGFLFGCFYIFRPLAEIGYIRAFAVAAALCTLSAIILARTDSTAVLIVARLITGLATAGLYAVGDSWINETAPPKSRGRILANYYVVLGVTSVLSQVFILRYSGDIADAFVTMAALYCIAIVVLTPTRSKPPEAAGKTRLRLRDAYRESPTVFLGIFVKGFVFALLISLLPYQASVAGIGANIIALVVGGFYLGRILLQMPIGRLADRNDKRFVIVGLSFVAALLLALLGIATHLDGSTIEGENGRLLQSLVIIGSILLGGAVLPLYSVLVAHAMDRTVPVYVGATAVTLLFVYTLGSVVGPIVGGYAVSGFGDRAIIWLSFALMLLSGLYAAARISWREAVPRAEASARVAAAPTSVSMTPQEKR